MSVVIIGAPFEGGSRKTGTSLAPAVLRTAGIASVFAGSEVVDLGDVAVSAAPDDETDAPPFDYVAANAALIRQAVRGVLENGDLPLLIGGDHSVSWGSMAALLDVCPDAECVYIDAHGDFNTPESSPTGNIHGMHIAFLTGLADVSRYTGAFRHAVMPFRRMHFYATRSLDPGERETAGCLSADITTAAYIRSHGIEAVCDALSRKIAASTSPHFHLSVDVDAVDPSFAPGTGVPEPDGLTPGEVSALIAATVSSGKIVSVDLVELNPALDRDGITCGVMLGFARVIAENLKKICKTNIQICLP